MPPLLAACRAILAVLLLLGLAGGTAVAVPLAAGTESLNLAAQVGYLEDPAGTLSVAEVAARPAADFRPAAAAGNDINFGYSGSAYWLRFTLEPAAGAPADWLLEVAFPSLDRIDFYGPEGTPLTAGDQFPFAQRPLAHRNFVFPLRLEGTLARTYLLRIRSDGTLTVPLHLWQPPAFQRHTQDSYAALSLYYGILLALLLYNLLLYVSIRDRSYLFYVLFVASMAVGQLSHNGLGNQYLWPEWPAWGNVAYPVGFALVGLFGALFTRSFLATARTTPRLDKLILALMGLFAFAALSPAFLSYRFAATLTSIGGISFSWITLIAAIVCLLRGHAGARYFLIAWALLLAAGAVLGLRNFGVLPTNFATAYSMQIGSALEMLLLSFALADRINTLRAEKEAAQRFVDAELLALEADEPGATAAQANTADIDIDRIEDRIAIIRAAAERQRAARKAREDTLRFISHDLRAPLASIVTVAEADCCERLRQTGRYAQGALDLADDLLRLATAQALLPARFAEVELPAVAVEAADEAWALAERKGMSVQVAVECADDAVVMGDAALLRRALTNLLGNAVKFGPEDSQIRLSLRQDGDWLEAAVADDGPGIPPERLAELFTRYRPAAHGQPAQAGAGLGLMIVKVIAERHGGSVSVDSEAGRGAIFRLRLPAAKPRGCAQGG